MKPHALIVVASLAGCAGRDVGVGIGDDGMLDDDDAGLEIIDAGLPLVDGGGADAGPQIDGGVPDAGQPVVDEGWLRSLGEVRVSDLVVRESSVLFAISGEGIIDDSPLATNELRFMELDTNGDTIWSRTFTADSQLVLFFSCSAVVGDVSWFGFGQSASAANIAFDEGGSLFVESNDAFLVGLDSDGNVVASMIIADGGACAMTALNDNAFVTLTYSSTVRPALLRRHASDGSVTSTVPIGVTPAKISSSLISVLPNGRIVFASMFGDVVDLQIDGTSYRAEADGRFDSVVVALDQDDSIAWARVVTSPDLGGLAFTGDILASTLAVGDNVLACGVANDAKVLDLETNDELAVLENVTHSTPVAFEFDNDGNVVGVHRFDDVDGALFPCVADSAGRPWAAIESFNSIGLGVVDFDRDRVVAPLFDGVRGFVDAMHVDESSVFLIAQLPALSSTTYISDSDPVEGLAGSMVAAVMRFDRRRLFAD